MIFTISTLLYYFNNFRAVTVPEDFEVCMNVEGDYAMYTFHHINSCLPPNLISKFRNSVINHNVLKQYLFVNNEYRLILKVPLGTKIDKEINWNNNIVLF